MAALLAVAVSIVVLKPGAHDRTAEFVVAKGEVVSAELAQEKADLGAYSDDAPAAEGKVRANVEVGAGALSYATHSETEAVVGATEEAV